MNNGNFYMHVGCSQYLDLPQILMDSTIIRAHACAAGATESSAQAEALWATKGGFTTKIHSVIDALGNPLYFILSGGQASDIGQAENLLALTAEGAAALTGVKGYDSDAFMKMLTKKDAEPVIPPRINRINARDCDWFVYKERHLNQKICWFP
ncbi:transposase [Nitrosomonas communis]|uniref:Transposase DDE domain-containing protein n=1 Tax=Nitrosomonas communis TaxID=44574 RepID=A0A1I4VI26_9PROT|nr:transposase [Nitrosomonas communis]SFN00894.1 Transposase DDE domain-containing protein [Nitrosomonas communis]